MSGRTPVLRLWRLAVQPDVSVHAFEPTPEIAARLRRMAALNDLQNLKVHDVAVVYCETTEVSLNRCRGEFGSNDGMNFITEAADFPDGERVAAVCLDRFCRDHRIDRIDLLKLDIQGQEHSALIGAIGLLEAGRIGTIFTSSSIGRKIARKPVPQRN